MSIYTKYAKLAAELGMDFYEDGNYVTIVIGDESVDLAPFRAIESKSRSDAAETARYRNLAVRISHRGGLRVATFGYVDDDRTFFHVPTFSDTLQFIYYVADMSCGNPYISAWETEQFRTFLIAMKLSLSDLGTAFREWERVKHNEEVDRLLSAL